MPVHFERKEYEERQRQRSMKRAEEHLKKVEEAVEKGRLKEEVIREG